MPKKPTPGGLVQVTLRLAPQVVDFYEDAAADEMRANPGQISTRADIMRRVLTQHAEERRAPKPSPKRARS